jgi:hypothetical protein
MSRARWRTARLRHCSKLSAVWRFRRTPPNDLRRLSSAEYDNVHRSFVRR